VVAIHDLVQVLPVVKEFHSRHLQEHLSHALSHKMAVRQEPTGTKDRTKLVARDSRKVLYSAIGFQKGESGSVSSLFWSDILIHFRQMPECYLHLGRDTSFKIASSSSYHLTVQIYTLTTK
jgi:hypothetical protein